MVNYQEVFFKLRHISLLSMLIVTSTRIQLNWNNSWSHPVNVSWDMTWEDICIPIMYSTTNLLNWITLIKSSLIFRIEIFLSLDCSSVKSRGCKRYQETIRYLTFWIWILHTGACTRILSPVFSWIEAFADWHTPVQASSTDKNVTD